MVRTRLQIVGVVALMALGSLALWIAIPAGWLWVTRDLQPLGARFLIVIVGCVSSMLGAGVFLYRLEAVYVRLTGATEPEPATPGWLRSVGDAGLPRRRLTLLETFLVVSALIALVGLVLWWALLADSPNPSGPLQPI
jgi:hypothetical protein